MGRPTRFFVTLPSSRIGAVHSWSATGRVAAFVLSFVALNLCVNVMWFHRHVPLWAPLLPSVEILVLMLGVALLSARGVPVSAAARVSLTAVLLCLVVLRFVNVGLRRFMRRELDVLQDLALAPDLVRLGLSTLPLWQFALAVLAVVGFLYTVGVLVWCALWVSEQALQNARLRLALYLAVAAVWLMSVVLPRAGGGYGVFAPTYLPRLVAAAEALFRMDERTERIRARLTERRAALSNVPTTFGQLAGRDVHLVFIESYGMGVFSYASYYEKMQPGYVQLRRRLAAGGLSVRSSRLRSPTFGGQSWLAHLTLSSGIRVDNNLDHKLVLDAHPQTLATLLGKAGYRTVGVWPGTTRPVTSSERRGFAEVIAAYDMAYAGPNYAWAPMPDQYVLDLARRRLAAARGAPRFVEYALVSSHFPFSPHPVYVEDWGRIGDGRIFHGLASVDHGVSWHDRSRAPEAYLSSLLYDLRVVSEFALRDPKPDSLYIVLGDHPPLAEVAGPAATHEVPIHVMSRDRVVLSPFASRGYVSGWRPVQDSPASGMEQFLDAFVTDFGGP